MTKIVLFFQAATLRSNSWREKINGIHRYAVSAHWQVQLVQSGAPADEIRYMIDALNPIGCIVDRGLSCSRNPMALFKDIPVVFMEQNPSTASRDCFNVNHDSAATTQMATQELIRTGVDHFSYVPHALKTHWNRERETTLADAVRAAGKTFIPWGTSPFSNKLTSARQDACIAQRLSSLPKPCGLLCANDQIAQRVMRVAQKTGLTIPDDLTLVGIDNDELICENSEPTLTSVQPDFQRCGYAAAELLDRRLHNPQTPPTCITYGPLQLFRRQSTMRYTFKNLLATQAMKIITAHALDAEFHTDKLAEILRCSRSLLELRIKEATGKTIRETVQDLRFTRALSLLKKRNLSISAIPSLCGYRSDAFFKRLFKKRTGFTMREWRTRHTTNDAGPTNENDDSHTV